MGKWTVKPPDETTPDLWADPIHGVARLAPEALEILDFIADYCQQKGYPAPVVTEIGRTKVDQEARYFEAYKGLLEDNTSGPDLEERARRMAYKRFSRHCIVLPDGRCYAFDLRSRIYTLSQIADIRRAVQSRFPKSWSTYHILPGNAWHLHFEYRTKSKPSEWM